MSPKRKYENIVDAINDISGEINDVLNSRKTQRYFDEIVLLYSFIENILKWLVFVKLLWDKSNKVLGKDETKSIGKFCKNLTFFNAQQLALSIGVIDWALFRRIDAIRTERNKVVHLFWLYEHRGNRLVLRKKLEKLATIWLR